MNPKIQKTIAEIEKTRQKISDYQSRLRELERQKIELENADIIALVRSVDILPDDLADFIRSYQEGKQSHAVPEMDTTQTNNTEDKADTFNLENKAKTKEDIKVEN